MADGKNESGPGIDCIERQERALGLDGEIAGLEAANARLLESLRRIAPAGYADALSAGKPTPSLDGIADLSVRTEVQKLSASYRTNLGIRQSYADERAKLATTTGADLAACRLDAALDRVEVDRRIEGLIKAKFTQLATALMDRVDLGNRFHVYRYEGEGGYSIFSRVPGTADFAYDVTSEGTLYERERIAEDELFFPVDPAGSPYDAAGDHHGYFFSFHRQYFRGPNRTWDMAAVDKYLRITPDDILREAGSLLTLMHEADRRNAELVASAERLVEDINADGSLDYVLEIRKKRGEREKRIEFFTKNPKPSRFLTYFTIPSWRVEDGSLALQDGDNKLTREYVDSIAAKLRKAKKL